MKGSGSVWIPYVKRIFLKSSGKAKLPGRSGNSSMRVLVTGYSGYIGSVLIPLFVRAGHEVVGLDSELYSGCDFGEQTSFIHAMHLDIRDVTTDELRDFDAVVHLAAICNDPIGDLDPDCTYRVNHLASVRLARVAKEA